MNSIPAEAVPDEQKTGPEVIPPLDPDFRPAALANRAFRAAAEGGVPVVVGLERENGLVSRYELVVIPPSGPYEELNFPYLERIVKFLLWQRGAHTVYIGGPEELGRQLEVLYRPGGVRSFDAGLMGRQVYEQPFRVIACRPADVPPAREIGCAIGGNMDGCRVGFDLGASDRKASAVIDGTPVFSEEAVWEPGKQSDPGYHYQEILQSIQRAVEQLPRLDAIGGSSAGILVNNRPMVASLFRAVPPERYNEVKNIFTRLQQHYGVPLEVINDGDVTALAGAMSMGEPGVLGIAMGSSEAAGYVDMHGKITGWLNELAFAPVDYNPEGPVDEWSDDRGCGASYFSQQCVFRLAPRAGIAIPVDIPDAERLKFAQEKLESGHPGAAQIWQTMGVYLGYGLAHYADFYPFRHALILGRCTSGSGGEIILKFARRVLEVEFPDLAAAMDIQLPDEKNRRVGQSIAAASLPEIEIEESR